jgi:hypothetical protein
MPGPRGAGILPAACNSQVSREDYLGKADLITAKQTAGRPQDLADLDELRRADAI